MDTKKKCMVWVGVLIGLVTSAWAFTPLGPFKPWQVVALGYNLPGDIGAPMTLSEAFRWNVPTVYYAFDASFIKYFGKDGIAAVEKAVAILNDLPPASQITNDSSHLYIRGQVVPLQAKHINFQAQAADCPLLDLKSYSLKLMIEELGLAEAERYIWTLRGRNTTTAGGVTTTNYTTVHLNYDPITLQPSSKVNENIYAYTIDDPILPQNYADAREIQLIGTQLGRSVAGAFIGPGEYFSGLTHDDVGGLRFLFSPNNLVGEGVLANVAQGRPVSSRFLSPWVPFGTLSNLFGNTNINFPTIPGFTNIIGTNLTNFVVQALRPGVDKVTFVRANYDSLLGINFVTVTNQFIDRYLSNSVPRSQPLQRAILQPDFLFASADLGLLPNSINPVLITRSDTANWVNNDAINGIAGDGGPGIISGPVVISFSSLLPFFQESSPVGPFLDENSSLFLSVCWGSFDQSTNAPIVYPKFLNLTIEDLSTLASGGGN